MDLFLPTTRRELIVLDGGPLHNVVTGIEVGRGGAPDHITRGGNHRYTWHGARSDGGNGFRIFEYDGPSKMDDVADDDTYAAALGLILYTARMTRGMTQSEVAVKLELSTASISRIERGMTGITLERALAWADALGLPHEVLIRASQLAQKEWRE